jgi:hypothetical protein
MADIAAARAEVQMVVKFLVNRFGSEEEVFGHLSLALSHLREDPPKAKEAVAVAPPPPPEETEEELLASVEVEEKEEEAPVVEEPPQLPRRYMSRRQR